jgi:hypothetical protein
MQFRFTVFASFPAAGLAAGSPARLAKQAAVGPTTVAAHLEDLSR